MTSLRDVLRISLIVVAGLVGMSAPSFAGGVEMSGGAETAEYMRVDQGADLANLWCNACHVISDQPLETGQDVAPPFPMLAPLVKADPDRYRAFLQNPHSPMREIALSRDEIDALIAYIESQDPG